MTETNSPIIESTDKGQFCWEVIDGIAVPFITRSSGEMFAELNMLKKTLFRKERQVLSDAIFNLACPTVNMKLLFEITDAERDLLDDINFEYCDNYFSIKPHSKNSNFLMKKDDAIELYQILRTFAGVALHKKLDTSKCGFLKINNSQTPIPFVDIENLGMLVVPLFFFDCPSVTQIAFRLTDYWALTKLKLCCKLLSIQPGFYDYTSLRVVDVDSLKSRVSEVDELSIFGSLPSQVKVADFLRTTSSIRSYTDEWLRNRTASINCDLTKTNANDVSMAKEPKLRHDHLSNTGYTINISDSSEDDEFIEENTKIKREVNETNTFMEEAGLSNNSKQLETPHDHAAKIPSTNIGHNTKGITQPIKSIGGQSVLTATKQSPAVVSSTYSPVLGSRNSLGLVVSSRNMLQPKAKMKEPGTIPLGMSTNTSPAMVQKQQTGSVVNMPGVEIQRPMGIFNPPVVQQSIGSEPQHIPGDHFGELKLIKCKRRFVKISPLTDKKMLKKHNNGSAEDSVADNSSSGSNVGNSGIIAQRSNMPLPVPGQAISKSDFNNMLMLQPNNIAHSSITTQAIGGFAQSTSFISLPTPNSVITPVISSSGALPYHSGFMGNAVPFSIIQNSGQLLANQSSFIINPNPVISSTSNSIITSAQNISNFQNVGTLSNGMLVCPIINLNNPNSLGNVDRLMVKTKRRGEPLSEEVLYKVNEIPQFKEAVPASFRVVRLKFKKYYTFMCISMSPTNHDDLLISVLEIIEQLFPQIARKTFMTIVTEMNLELYTLNVQQKTVLRSFYKAGRATDVTSHLYFIYSKFNAIYNIIKQRVL